MRDYELDLIAALVEGRLEDESEARALIDSSAEHREEYEAQKLAYQATQGVGTARLTDSERAALHRDLWTVLREKPGARPTTTPWYFRWAPVAAGLFIAVGLVAVLSQGGSGDSAGEVTLAADTAAETTSTAADSVAEAGGDTDAGDDSVEQGAASPQDETESDGADEMADTAVDVYRREAEMLRQGIYGDRLRSYEVEDEEVEACIEESGLDDHRVLATLDSPTADQMRVAVAYPNGAELDTAPLSFVDLVSCEVVYVDG